jgi:hypothetical protein
MKYLCILSILALFTGCGSSVSTEETDDNNDGEIIDPYADLPGYSGNPFAGFGPVMSVSFPAEGTTDIQIESQSSPGGLWSVQIAACSGMDAAQNLRDAVAVETGLPVFIDQSGSYYKVRVGSFATSEETDELRNRLRSGGYPEAWSVERETTPPEHF